jgi:putative chitinase
MSISLLQTKIGIPPANVDGIFGPNTLRHASRFFNLSRVRAAHFFGQTAHETGGFVTFVENLNYSAERLRQIFPRHFPTDQIAREYARNPERIANRAYANRMANGPESSGDGWRFRGRGALQTTGRNNYKAFSEWANDPSILQNPDVVATSFAFESALFFFQSNSLWPICDRGVDTNTITQLTRRINGGTHGLEDRIRRTNTYFLWLA